MNSITFRICYNEGIKRGGENDGNSRTIGKAV